MLRSGRDRLGGDLVELRVLGHTEHLQRHLDLVDSRALLDIVFVVLLVELLVAEAPLLLVRALVEVPVLAFESVDFP